MTGVAVVIPCFNLGRTIEETLASVEAQSHSAAELLVVDDGSDDIYTLQVLARARRFGVHVVTTVNQGVAAARNFGVGLTSSPYIVLLDADDALEPSYLERLSGVLDQHADLDFVTCGVRAFGQADYVWTPPECTWIQTLTRGGPHVSSMFRRSLWQSVGGFDSSLDGYEDMDFWLSALERGHRGTVVPEPLLRYRVRQGSRYHRAVMGPTYAATMERIYRKHPARTALDGRALLMDKDAFLAEQQAYKLDLIRQRSDLEQKAAGLREEIATAKTRIEGAGQQILDWGDLRRVSPISPVWGLDRGGPLDRHFVESFLERHRADIHGRVLEVKDSGYTRRFGGAQVTAAEVLDIDAANPAATIVADLARPSDVPADFVDCFVFTQTLHMIYDTKSAIASAFRLLKPGGTLLCTVPCVSRVDYENNAIDEGDFWRFTPAAMRALFAEVFPIDAFEVERYGNVMTCAAFLHGLSPHEVSREVLDTHDPMFPLLCSIRAMKPQTGTETTAPVRRWTGRAAGHSGDSGLVLLYHRVGRRTPDTYDLCVDTPNFRDQMRHLRDHYNLLPLDELLQKTLDGTVPMRAVAVTFDDGYAENLDVVSPILTEFNIAATFFLNTDRLDEEHECWWDLLERVLISEEERPSTLDLFGDGRWVRPTTTADDRWAAHRGVMEILYAASAGTRTDVINRLIEWSGRQFPPRRSHRPMTRAEIVELAAQPGHAIGAHTVNHLCLARQTFGVQVQEIADSKAALERLLGRQITAFAYPYGDFSGRTVDAVRHAGLSTAVTVEGRLVRPGAHPLMVPRLEVKQCGVEDFSKLLEPLFAAR